MDITSVVKDFKVNYKRVLFPLILFIVMNLSVKYVYGVFNSSFTIYPSIALHPVFGLLFGPWGALGTATGNLITDIIGGYSPWDYIPCFFVDFIFAYLPYKLWYVFALKKKRVSAPKLNSVYTLFKFLGIILFACVVYSSLIMILLTNSGIASLLSLTTLKYILNSFDFAFIFGIFFIIVFNMKKIKFTSPKINKFPKINDKYYHLTMILSLILIFSYFIVFGDNLKALNSYLDNIWAYVIIGLLLFYINIPVKNNIINARSYYSSMIEKIVLIFLVFTLLFILLFAIASYHQILTEIGLIGSTFSVLLYMDIALFTFYLPGIVVLAYLERKVTTPIELFANTAKNYVNADNKIDKSANLISNYAQYAKDTGEIGDLANSFTKMIKDLENYMENLKQVTSEKERITAELNVAKKIQESILPKDFPNNNDFEIVASMCPAKEVGGDFYDFFDIDDDHIAIVIGDASGKGMPAALFTVIAKSLIKDHLQLGESPSDTFKSVNNQLCENNKESMFVTAWAGVLELSTGKFTFVNAGHNHPLLKKTGLDYQWLNSKPGLVLGGMEGINYKENEIYLAKGDELFLYTDGVTEAHNEHDDLFSDDYLLKVINEKYLDINAVLSYIYDKIDEFKGSREQFDDITMLGFIYKK